jgi:putative restriction endonuclease
VKNRTNPRNGLCMNPFFHRAFDKFLICVTPDYTIEVSEQMLEITKDEKFRRYLEQLHHTEIYLPDKFSPDKNLLAIHHEQYRKNS